AAATLLAQPLDLLERVHCEPSRAFQPALVASPLECLEKRVAVPRRAVADTRSLFQRRRPGAPDELRTVEHELGVYVLGRPDNNAGRARAPLDADLPVRPG